MKNLNKILFDDTWYRQFVYGAILAILFGAPTLLAGFNPAWTILQVFIFSGIREYYVKDLIGEFNWRNFFFLLVPVLVFYIAYTSF